MCRKICFGRWTPWFLRNSFIRLRPINDFVKRNVPMLGHGEIVNHANTRWVECLKGATQTTNKAQEIVAILWPFVAHTKSKKLWVSQMWPKSCHSSDVCIEQNLWSDQKWIVGLRRQSPSVSRRLPPHPHLGQVSPISVDNWVEGKIKTNSQKSSDYWEKLKCCAYDIHKVESGAVFCLDRIRKKSAPWPGLSDKCNNLINKMTTINKQQSTTNQKRNMHCCYIPTLARPMW